MRKESASSWPKTRMKNWDFGFLVFIFISFFIYQKGREREKVAAQPECGAPLRLELTTPTQPEPNPRGRCLADLATRVPRGGRISQLAHSELRRKGSRVYRKFFPQPLPFLLLSSWASDPTLTHERERRGRPVHAAGTAGCACSLSPIQGASVQQGRTSRHPRPARTGMPGRRENRLDGRTDGRTESRWRVGSVRVDDGRVSLDGGGKAGRTDGRAGGWTGGGSMVNVKTEERTGGRMEG